jgi:hypothetical protein
MSAVINLLRTPFIYEAEMRVEYCIVVHDKGWMIERQGQFYGPYASKQEAVREATYVANYSTDHGLRAQVRAHKSDYLATDFCWKFCQSISALSTSWQ